MKLRECCLFMAAKSTILSGSNSEGIKSELVSNLLDLITIHGEHLSAESNDTTFSHFLLQVVDSVFCKYFDSRSNASFIFYQLINTLIKHSCHLTRD